MVRYTGRFYFFVRFVVLTTLLTILSITVSFQCVNASRNVQSDSVSLYDRYIGDIFVTVNDSPCEQYSHVKGMQISNSGSFLVVLSDVTTHYIDVYNEQAEFQNQIVLHSPGSVYVSFGQTDGELIIYLSKEQLRITTEIDGTFISASENETVPLSLLEEYGNAAYEKDVNSYRYSVKSNNNGRTVLVESQNGDVICQYVTPFDTTSLYIIPVVLILVVVVFLRVKQKDSKVE